MASVTFGSGEGGGRGAGGSGRDEFLPGLLLLALRPGLTNPEPLEPPGITLLLLPRDPKQLQMKQEALPPKMLLLSRSRNEDQLGTENVNTHPPQPEKPTHPSRQPSHQTDFFNFFHHPAFERN